MATRSMMGGKYLADKKTLVYPSGTVGGYGCIYALSTANIPVVALNAKRCSNFHSRFIREKHVVPDPIRDHESFVAWLIDYGKKQDEPPVLVMAEDLYAYIVHLYQDELRPYFRYPYISHDLLPNVFNKKAMRAVALQAGLTCPETVFAPLTGEMIAAWKHFPAVIKPLVSRFTFQGRKLTDAIRFPRLFGGKVVFANNTGEIQALSSRLTDLGIDFCLQRFVPGSDCNLLGIQFVADRSGDIPACSIARKVRQQPADFGTRCVSLSEYRQELHEFMRAYCQEADYFGPGCAEFKQGDDGRWYFMEVNPRFAFSIGTAVMKGINLPLQHYLLSTGQPLFSARQNDNGKYWIDIPGDIKGLCWRYGKKEWHLTIREIIRPYLWFTEAMFNWKDPVPGLWRIGGWILSSIRKGFTRLLRL
jgi:D-aspartate ligase